MSHRQETYLSKLLKLAYGDGRLVEQAWKTSSWKNNKVVSPDLDEVIDYILAHRQALRQAHPGDGGRVGA